MYLLFPVKFIIYIIYGTPFCKNSLFDLNKVKFISAPSLDYHIYISHLFIDYASQDSEYSTSVSQDIEYASQDQNMHEYA